MGPVVLGDVLVGLMHSCLDQAVFREGAFQCGFQMPSSSSWRTHEPVTEVTRNVGFPTALVSLWELVARNKNLVGEQSQSDAWKHGKTRGHVILGSTLSGKSFQQVSKESLSASYLDKKLHVDFLFG